MVRVMRIVRKPGRVKFIWDYRQFMLGGLKMEVVPLVIIVFIIFFPLKPIEGYEDFLSTWGTELLFGVLLILLAFMYLKLQGIILVNQTESKIEIYKGFGLSTRVHSLYFDTLEKVVLAPTAPSLFAYKLFETKRTPPQVVDEQVGIHLKTGEEIELPFARLEPEEALKVVKEIAEAAGIPAFDRAGNPIHPLQPLGSPA